MTRARWPIMPGLCSVGWRLVSMKSPSSMVLYTICTHAQTVEKNQQCTVCTTTVLYTICTDVWGIISKWHMCNGSSSSSGHHSSQTLYAPALRRTGRRRRCRWRARGAARRRQSRPGRPAAAWPRARGSAGGGREEQRRQEADDEDLVKNREDLRALNRSNQAGRSALRCAAPPSAVLRASSPCFHAAPRCPPSCLYAAGSRGRARPPLRPRQGCALQPGGGGGGADRQSGTTSVLPARAAAQ